MFKNLFEFFFTFILRTAKLIFWVQYTLYYNTSIKNNNNNMLKFTKYFFRSGRLIC